MRDFVSGDFDAIHADASDPDVTRFMFHEIRRPEDARGYLNRTIASQGEEPRLKRELAVVLASVNRLLGRWWTSNLYEVKS